MSSLIIIGVFHQEIKGAAPPPPQEYKKINIELIDSVCIFMHIKYIYL